MTAKGRDLLILAAVAALLYAPWLGARDLWNPNEPLYGQAVAEMAERGDRLVPTVNGAIFDEKPILYFWLALGSAEVAGGVDEFTLRLPSAVAGIVSVLLLYVLVLPYAGRRRAGLAGLLLATTFVVFWSARQVQMDLLLAACTLASVLGGTRAIDRLWARSAGWGLAGVAAGTGFLAKGPVGLVCPALVLIAYAIVTGRVRELARPALLWGGVAIVVVGAPWYVMLWARGETGFLTELLVRQNLLRFVEPWDHQAPWWYYLGYFWIDMAPWSWFVPLAWGLAPDDRRERRLHRLAWSWVVAVVFFFSLSASKRSPYILPVAPAVAVLVAGVVGRALAARLGPARAIAARLLQAVIALGFLAGGLVLAAGSTWVDSLGPAVGRSARAAVVVLCAGGLLALAGAFVARRRPAVAAASLWVAVAAVYLGVSATALPAANAFKSHRPFCESIRSHVEPEQPLRGFHEWRWRAGYSYYTGRVIPNLETVDQLREYWTRPERVFLVVEQGRLDEARAVIGPVAPLEERAIGSNFAYLFANRESPVPLTRAGRATRER
jgi:4-amino-4-deoxy-L-arabinose transferase-like glycosyltransferase